MVTLSLFRYSAGSGLALSSMAKHSSAAAAFALVGSCAVEQEGPQRVLECSHLWPEHWPFTPVTTRVDAMPGLSRLCSWQLGTHLGYRSLCLSMELLCRARGTTVGAQLGLDLHEGSYRKPGKVWGPFNLLPLPRWGSKSVCAFLKSGLGFWQPHCQSHWRSNLLRDLSFQCWTPGMGCLIRGSNSSLPRKGVIPLLFCVPLQGHRSWPDCFSSPPDPNSVWIFLTAFRMPVSSLFPVRTAPQFWCLHGGRWAPCPPPPSWSPPLIDSLVYWTFYLNNKLVSSVINYKSWFLKPVFYISNTYTTGIIILLLTFLHSVTNSNNSIRL